MAAGFPSPPFAEPPHNNACIAPLHRYDVGMTTHKAYENDRDRADFAEADRLVADGKALRARVNGRIRARVFRAKREERNG